MFVREEEYDRSDSFINTIFEDVLFLLPLSAGRKIIKLDDLGRMRARPWAEWLVEVLDKDVEELCTALKDYADDCDHIVRLTVILWKQRHGVFPKTLRPVCDLGEEAQPLLYHLHRYMAIMGYVGLLEGRDPYTGVNRDYIKEIESLLARWRQPGFSDEEAEFDSLVRLLSVAGPRSARHSWRNEAILFVEYVLANAWTDPRLSGITSGPSVTELVLVMKDLGLSSVDTFPFVERALDECRTLHTQLFPGLVAGIEMYGEPFSERLRKSKVSRELQILLDLLAE